MGIGIQVTIRFLSLGNQIDDLVGDGTELLALSVSDAEGHRFQPFVQVCVLENGAPVDTLLLCSMPSPRPESGR